MRPLSIFLSYCIIVYSQQQDLIRNVQWDYLGPFLIGKGELDIDPTASEGGIVSLRDRHMESPLTSSKFPSELVKGGYVEWKKLMPGSGRDGGVSYGSEGDWQGLYNAAGAEVLEHQGWAVTSMKVKAKKSRVRLACLGVVSFYLRHLPAGETASPPAGGQWETLRPFAGDIYQSGQIASYLTLPGGRYEIFVHTRAKTSGSFSCSAQVLDWEVVRKDPLSALRIVRAPDVWEGLIMGDYMAISVANRGESWIYNATCMASVPSPSAAAAASVKSEALVDEARQRSSKSISTDAYAEEAAWAPLLEYEPAHWEALPIAPGATIILPCRIGSGGGALAIPPSSSSEILASGEQERENTAATATGSGGGGAGPFYPPMQSAPKCVTSAASGGEKNGAVSLSLQIMGIVNEQVLTLSKLSYDLQCRSVNQSSIMTYIDHDASIQHAAFIAPLPIPRIAEKEAEEEEEARQHGLPVLLTLHGTGVSAGQQADAYKFKPKNAGEGVDYTFGVEGYWLLAPSRHGAHNWEGIGQLSAISALHSLARYTRRMASSSSSFSPPPSLSQCTTWRVGGVHCLPTADPLRVLFAGHSMGGAGAWHISTALPDIAIAAAPSAGWLSKELYGDSNTFMKLDLAEPFLPGELRGVLLSSVADQRADAHASNLGGIPTYIRVGAADATTHPFYSRRMLRILRSVGAGGAVDAAGGPDAATSFPKYEEMAGKEHWWWDTDASNDGGVLNDAGLRSFYKSQRRRLSTASILSRIAAAADPLKALAALSARQHTVARALSFTVTQPAVYRTGRLGLRIVEQLVPQEPSRLDVSSSSLKASSGDAPAANIWFIDTANVKTIAASFTLQASSKLAQLLDQQASALLAEYDSCRSIAALLEKKGAEKAGETSSPLLIPALICLDGQLLRGSSLFSRQQEATVSSSLTKSAQQIGTAWSATLGLRRPEKRTARAATQAPFLISVDYSCNDAASTSSASINASNAPLVVSPLDIAILLSNQHLLAYDTIAPILSPREACSRDASSSSRVNEIAIKKMIQLDPVHQGVSPSLSLVEFATVPRQDHHVDLFITAQSDLALWLISVLARSTIPPMVRAPFNNYLPEYLLCDKGILERGAAGILAAGYLNSSLFFGNPLSLHIL